MKESDKHLEIICIERKICFMSGAGIREVERGDEVSDICSQPVVSWDDSGRGILKLDKYCIYNLVKRKKMERYIKAMKHTCSQR